MTQKGGKDVLNGGYDYRVEVVVSDTGLEEKEHGGQS